MCEGCAFLSALAAVASFYGFTLNIMTRFRTLALGMGLAIVATMTTILDIAFPVVLSNREGLLAAGVGLVFAAPLLTGPRWQWRALVVAFFLGWLLALPHIAWDARKPFRRVFNGIRQGMSLEDVESEFRREFSDHLPRGRYQAYHWSFCLGPSDGPFNSEIIAIDVRDSRVVSAEYLLD